MNLPDIPLFDLLRTRMSWLSARQDVLAQNVANADTPGYSAQDLKPVDFENELTNAGKRPMLGGGLTVTDPRHISIAPSSASGFQTAPSDEAQTRSTGNSVSVQEEIIKVADTQAQYQAAANLYSKALGMMRTAIDKSGP